MCGEILQEVQEAKYLGITISSNLKWEKHVNNKTSRANATLHLKNITTLPRASPPTGLFHASKTNPRVQQ